MATVNSFDQVWAQSQRAKGSYAVQEFAKRLPRHQRYDAGLKRRALENFLPSLELRFSERRKIQRAVYEVFGTELAGSEYVLDIFSGEPTAVLPLLEAGTIGELTVVDTQIDESLNVLREELAKGLTPGLRARFHDLKLGITRATSSLPSVEEVTLIESGISLPYANRQHENDIFPEDDLAIAPFIRSSQIGLTTVTFGEVLEALAGATKRTLHVFDTAVIQRPLSQQAHRAYVQGFVEQVPGWNIEKWTSLKTEAPVRYGVLRYERP